MAVDTSSRNWRMASRRFCACTDWRSRMEATASVSGRAIHTRLNPNGNIRARGSALVAGAGSGSVCIATHEHTMEVTPELVRCRTLFGREHGVELGEGLGADRSQLT